MHALSGLSGLSSLGGRGSGGSGFQDTFNRADTPLNHDVLGLSSDGKKTWLIPDVNLAYSPGNEYGWAIRSNAATITTANAGLNVTHVPSLSAYGRAKITVKTPSSTAPFYLVARYADHSNYVGMRVIQTGFSAQQMVLFKVVAGVSADLRDFSVDFVNYQAGDTFELELAVGDIGRMYWNGVQQGANVTTGLSVLTGNTSWGMAVNYNNAVSWDGAIEQYDFTAG